MMLQCLGKVYCYFLVPCLLTFSPRKRLICPVSSFHRFFLFQSYKLLKLRLRFCLGLLTDILCALQIVYICVYVCKRACTFSSFMVP